MHGVTSALTDIAGEALAQFGDLKPGQLNWQPGPGRWSVAQCLEHLMITQSTYFPVLDRLAEGTFSPTTWERYSPFSGLLGRMLIRSLDPANTRRTKTVATSRPSESAIGADIVERFALHQDELVARLRALPGTGEPRSVVITSPLSRFVTYSLADCLTILVVHGRRHLAQAQRVTATAGFPPSD